MPQDLHDPTGNEGRSALAAAEAQDALAHASEFNEGSEAIRFIRFIRTTGFGRAYIEVYYPERREQLRQRFVRHSPDGMEFGYAGSGPADAALNVLALFIPIEEAEQIPTHYQDFKFRFIAPLNQHVGGEIMADDIRAWIRERRSRGNES